MILSADIGGTKTNIGISSVEHPVKYTKKQTYLNENFKSFAEIVNDFVDPTDIEIMVLGIAGPIKGRYVELTNLHWTIDAHFLENKFDCKVFLLNDLEAAAYTIPYLDDEDITVVYNPDTSNKSDIEVIAAAGTGLGVAKIYHGSSKKVFPSEGGHIGVSPQSDFQHTFFKYIQNKHNHVSYEMSVSSIGYKHLQNFLQRTNYFNLPEDFLERIQSTKNLSKLISNNRDHEDDLISSTCKTILGEFSNMLGSFLGDISLVHLPRSIYLTGGIGRNISIRSELKDGFLDKANMSHVVKNISMYIITDPDCGLHGCSWYAKEYLNYE